VTVGQGGTPFRIDHDEKFNQTTHLQYQPWQRGPWVGFNWRYDSGRWPARFHSQPIPRRRWI